MALQGLGAGLHRDVLHAVDGVRRRHTGAEVVGSKAPQQSPGPGVEGAKVPSPEEDQAPGRRQDRPTGPGRELVVPDPLARVEVPGLQLADVVGPVTFEDLELRAGEVLAGMYSTSRPS